jgi:opacity protein-like surface antigen
MRNLIAIAAAFVVVTLALPDTAHSQVPGLGIEITSGWSIPTGDFADGPDGGWIYGIGATYRVLSRLDVYGGYTHVDHGSDEWRSPLGGEEMWDVGVATDAFRLGARYLIPLTGFQPWIGAGVHTSQSEFTFSAGGDTGGMTMDRRPGWEVGAGAYVGLADRISLVPAVRYSSHPLRHTDAQGFTYDGDDVTYIALELGLRFAF